MALTQEQIDKYGLSKVDGGSIGDGVIESGGNYYKLNNFERQQNEKLDTDQGDVFGSSLEADSGVDYSNFNTINDVQGAVRAMEGVKTEKKPVEYSPHLQEAHNRVNQWEKNRYEGTTSKEIYGQEGQTSFDERSENEKQGIASGFSDERGQQQAKAAQLFSDDFINKVKRDASEMLNNSTQI